MTASAMPVLKELYSQFSDKIDFLTLYIREVHPGGLFPQPTMVMDSLDGDLHKTLYAKSDDAYLVNDQGIVVFRYLWSTDEEVLGADLSDLVGGQKPQRPRSTAVMGPVVTAVGHFTDTIKLTGPQPTRALIRSASPMYMMGWIIRPVQIEKTQSRHSIGVTV